MEVAFSKVKPSTSGHSPKEKPFTPLIPVAASINLAERSLVLPKAAAPKNKSLVVDRMQTSRWECKYIISEAKTQLVRDLVSLKLYPDEFTLNIDERGYLVTSLYLDGPDSNTYRDTVNGNRNRFKLRIRFYDEDPESPAFLEVKRRANETMTKTRAAVSKEAVERFLATGVPCSEADLLKDSDSHIRRLANFNRLVLMLDARPAAYTSYYRQGFEPLDNNETRVTFDRDLRSGVFNGRLSAADRENWRKIDVPGVILEMKFTDRPPAWMQAIVHEAELQRTGMAKYVRCLEKERGWETP